MAFPATSVLDTFSRANENPLSLGGAWPANIDTDNGDLQLLNNAVTGTAAASCNAYWTTTFGPDCEAFVSLASLQGNADKNVVLGVRLADAGTATPDGYVALFFHGAGNDSLLYFRLDNGAPTQLGSTQLISLATNDTIGLRMIGATLQAFRNGVAFNGVTDTTYTAAGKIGLGCSDTVVRMTNFGGGTLNALTFTVASSGSTDAAGTVLAIPSSVFTANSVVVLALHQRTSVGATPPIISSVAATGLTFTSSASTLYDDAGAVRGRFDTLRSYATQDVASVVTVTYASTFSALTWTAIQVSGVSQAGNGTSALSQPTSLNSVGNSSITAILASSFASSGNGVLAFFGHDSVNTMFAGAAPNVVRLSFVTLAGPAGNQVLGSFYTSKNLSSSTATTVTNAQYGGAVFEVVLDEPLGVVSTSTAQLWALTFVVAPFEAVA